MPDIEATLCFLASLPKYQTEKPFRLIPGAGKYFKHDISNVVAATRDRIRITDIRNRVAEFNLDRNGFEVLSHKSAHPTLDSEKQVNAYKAETVELLMSHLNAEKVICFDFRHRIHQEFEKGTVVDYNDPTTREGPAIMAHSDHTFESGLVVVNAHLSDDEKERYLSGDWRIRLMNTWRPLLVSKINHLQFVTPVLPHPVIWLHVIG
ncbi:hypothetical protein BDV96DRAFT_694734 [Lophiotrema nucula]|uniref:Uncharacterized protein n=1 Tax=Lophiotrema nucula TaxID=690887 RepID=A0A6A5YHD1_9PLEO|nr:hypothetical protein BDV96DRAFT_694734 [Lophiotrema nucula]